MTKRFNLAVKVCLAGAILAAVIVTVAAPVRAYVTSLSLNPTGTVLQNKWKSFPVTWKMNPARGANVTGTREQADVFRLSFAPWAAISTASVSFTDGGTADVKPAYDGTNVLTTSLTAAEYAALGGGNALGVTLVSAYNVGGPDIIDNLGRTIEFPGQILEADIMFNPATPYTTNATGVSDRYDFQSVATHEIGHFIGMEHTSIIAATMFPRIATGFIYPRVLGADDIAGISSIYPAASFATKGTISGSVRTTSNTVVYGAIVTAVNASGVPVASAITNPSGQYTIGGLDAGAYTVYAESMDEPLTFNDVAQPLLVIYPSSAVNTNFTTRFR